MFGSTWRIGRVAGIDLRVDASWLFIAALIGLSFYGRFLQTDPQVGTAGAVALAVGSAIVFFGSVLLHELAHSLVAVARGIPVRGITLFLFGGVTEARVESRGPKEEFLIAVVGPLTSAVLAAVLWVLSGVVGDSAIGGALGYLAWVNLALAIFNLLPGLPLDGGRVLRSAVWGATGSVGRATKVSSIGGQALGYLLIAVGLFSLVQGAFGGLWFAAIGWFLLNAAKSAYQELRVRRLLDGADAADAMATRLITVPATLTVDDAIRDYFLRFDHSAFPVVEGGETLGLLTLRNVRRLDPTARATRLVRDCMTPLDRTVRVAPGSPLQSVVEQLQDEDVNRVLVVERGRVVGLITANDVARWLRRSEELGLDTRRPAA